MNKTRVLKGLEKPLKPSPHFFLSPKQGSACPQTFPSPPLPPKTPLPNRPLDLFPVSIFNGHTCGILLFQIAKYDFL